MKRVAFELTLAFDGQKNKRKTISAYGNGISF